MKAPVKHPSLCLVFLLLCLSPLAQAQSDSSEQTSITALLKAYFAACEQKDLSALVRLWSERSPDLAASIEEAQRNFAAADYVFSDLSPSGLRIAGAKAVLQVNVVATITNIQTKAVRQERLARNFALIKDRGEWKVWRDAPAAEDLSAFLEKGSEWKVSRDSIEQFANVLIASPGTDERNKLLTDNKQMLTADLRDALIRRIGPLQAARKLEAAISILEIVQAVAERIGDRRGVAIAQLEMGDANRALGRSAKALNHYRNALSEFEAIGNRRDKATALSSIALVYFLEKNYAEAIANYEKAFAEYEAVKSRPGMANTLEDLASVCYDREDYGRALEYFERCLKLREAMGNKAEIAATLNSIGNVHFQRQDYGLAILAYQKSLAGFEELNDADAIASTCNNIGSSLYSSGDYDRALDYYQRGLKLEDKLREKQVAADLRRSIATLYNAQGNYILALESLSGALTTFESLRIKNKSAATLSEIAEAHSKLRNYSLSLEHYQKSLKLYEEIRSIADTSMTHYSIGNIHFAMGKFDSAIESYRTALAQFEAIKHAPGVASMFASIGGVYFAEQKYDLALDLYQKSLAKVEEVGDKARAAGVIERIASVYYSQKEYAMSLDWATRAVAMAEQGSYLETLWRGRLTQGFAYRATGQIEQTRKSFELSIAAIESLRGNLVRGEADAQHFFQRTGAAYVSMMELLVAQNRIAEAFAFAERIRSHSLQDIVQNPRARITKTMTDAEISQERELENQIVQIKARISREQERKQPDRKLLGELNARLQEGLTAYRAFEEKLYTSHPSLKTLRGEGSPVTLEQAAELLPDASTALLEFVVADSSTYLFLLTREPQRRPSARNQERTFALNAYTVGTGRNEIFDRVRKFRELIAERSDKVQQNGRELYELLFASAASQLAGKTRWLILPDGALWQLPFSALQSEDNRYLIEDHSIAYAPSLSALAEMSKPRVRAGGNRLQAAGLFANPVISRQTADRLRLAGAQVPDASSETESEVKTIERRDRSGASKAYVGAQASEEFVKREAGKFDLIHFAATSFLNDANPMYSYVTLSQSPESAGEDGLLETWEMMRLNLEAGLFVFSQSAVPSDRIGAGEAITGLAWSLLVAGCPASVVSLWRTDAAASNTMMSEFHRELQLSRGQRVSVSKAKALQRAALKLIRGTQFREPFYWSGFALVGSL